jgi:hypothetical protein
MPSSNAGPTKEAGGLLRMASGFVTSQVLYVTAELGIADHLASGALSAQDLASKTGTHADALARLLRALVAFGILKCEGENSFLLTPTGELLRTDVPGSQRATVRFLNGPWFWRAWENLSHSVRTGEPAFDRVWGMSNFEYWACHPDVSEIHDEAMAGLTAMETAQVLAAYDFSQFRAIADVGGGNGAFLAALLRQHPKVTGLLADLPHVVSLAPSVLQQAGVANRCEVVNCDFFEAAPSGGDAYILKHVIVDWGNDRAEKILRNCHNVMRASAKLLVIDMILPEHPIPEAAIAYVADMTMLAQTPGGRARTQGEFQKLLESAGFECTRIIRTGGTADIIEAQKRA